MGNEKLHQVVHTAHEIVFYASDVGKNISRGPYIGVHYPEGDCDWP